MDLEPVGWRDDRAKQAWSLINGCSLEQTFDGATTLIPAA
jgi:hypothetical protein